MSYRLRGLCFLLFSVGCAPALAQTATDLSKGRPPALLDPRVAPNVVAGADPAELPEEQRSQAEPHIVRSATNPEVLLATFQEGRYAQGSGAITCGFAVSEDGGLTWSRALIPHLAHVNGGAYFRATDPVAAIGPQGEFYLNNLVSTDGTFGRAAVVVSRSSDVGATWSAPVEVFRSPGPESTPDKNWISANDFPGTANAGRLAVSWTNFRTAGTTFTGTDISLATSDDRGATWTQPVAVTPSGANDQGSLPLFLPDGSLVVIYVTFFGNTPTFGIRCKRSLDGGRTFPANATTVVHQIDEWHDPALRHGPYLPAATVARQSGALFVTYVGLVAPGQPRVFVTRSLDRGATWSAPVIASDQPEGVSVVNPAVAATPDGRTVSVLFIDKRHASDGRNFVDHYAAVSFDGGATWQPNLRLSEMTSDVRFAPQTSSGYMLGDYLGLAPPYVGDQPFVALWCDTRAGNSDPIATRFLARPLPSYGTWAALHRLPSGSSNFLDDDDDDGDSNYLEFLHGTHPLRADAGENLVVRRVTPTTLEVAWPERVGVERLPIRDGIAVATPATFRTSGFSLSATLGANLDAAELPSTSPGEGATWRGVRVTTEPNAPQLVARSVRFSAGLPGRASQHLAAIGGDGRLINLSTRGRVDANADAQLIAGFVLDGNRSILIRGAGPALSALGIAGALADPQLSLLARASDLDLANDNWAAGAATAELFARAGAFPFGANSLDAALFLPLGSQLYTASVSGRNNATGIALVEIYDTGTSVQNGAPARLLNLSTRGHAGAGANALIAGFVLGGTQPRRILLRAIGPGLAPFNVAGALADPELTLFRGATRLAANDDWQVGAGAAAVAAVAQRVGAFSLAAASRDAALLITLEPGAYTAVISGASGQTGIALIEIYDAD